MASAKRFTALSSLPGIQHAGAADLGKLRIPRAYVQEESLQDPNGGRDTAASGKGSEHVGAPVQSGPVPPGASAVTTEPHGRGRRKTGSSHAETEDASAAAPEGPSEFEFLE